MSTRPEPVSMNAVDVDVVLSGGPDRVPWLIVEDGAGRHHQIRVDAVLSWSVINRSEVMVRTVGDSYHLVGAGAERVDRLLNTWLVIGPRGPDLPSTTRVLGEAIAYEGDLLDLLDDLHDGSPCHLDHHGYCQAHGWLQEGECADARAQRLLREAGRG